MRVLLVPNLFNRRAVAATCEIATWLVAQGFDAVLADEDAAGCENPDIGVPASEIGEPGLVVSVGGDGTILKAVHLLGDTVAPILGLNYGRRGFMTGASPDSVYDSVTAALAGEGRIERRATLEAAVVMQGREVGRYRALNEVYVARGGSGRVIDISLAVNGIELLSSACDGVIVATATGSTAYALSAGGPVVSPDVNCAVVVPVAPHTLNSRPIVVGARDEVVVSLPNPSRADACVSVDGHLTPCRRSVESITVRHSDTDVLLVKLDGRDFYEVVRDEFFGG